MKKIQIIFYYIFAVLLKKLANANFGNNSSEYLKKFKKCMQKIYNLKNAKKKKNQRLPRNTKVYNEFCEINSNYWEEIMPSENSPTVLVEGFFAESGPNYVMRVGTIAKTLEKTIGAKLLVLLRLSGKREHYKKQIWQSFKINNFVGMFDDIFENFSYFKKIKISFLSNALYYWSKFLFFLNRREQFIEFSFKGVRVGDILYDDLIKESSMKEYTINEITPKHKYFFRKFFMYFYISEFIYEKYKFKYYLTTHTQYISYGLPTRYFAHHGITIIETTDDILFIYDDFKTYPRFHSEINRMIRKKFDKIYNDETLLYLAKTELSKRFSGESEQIDAQMAYANKKNYSREMLKKTLGINNDNPIVFIFAHIFSDTPQGASKKMLFADYYQWLIETIKYIRNIYDINWIIKPHPSSKVYKEEGEVAKLIYKLCKPNSSVFICPDDFNTSGVLYSANAIITVQGTVGLEYSSFGIPIILAGEPFYAGFGFTNEPKTKKEYFEQLKNIKNIKPLNENQMRAAIAVYHGFNELMNKDFSLIDTKLKDLTWGCSREQDILGAYELMSERLKSINPKTRPLCGQIEEYFSKNSIKGAF